VGVSAARTLTVACYGGLANRLRVLCSAVVMAELTGRRLTMWWPQLPTCGAAFHELFENDLPVKSFAGEPGPRPPAFDGTLGRDYFDVLKADQAHVRVTAVTWLAQPDIYPHHAPVLERCAAVLDGLRPVAEIAERVAGFRRAEFRERMIGVHLRRGDFHRASRHSVDNTQAAIAATRRYLERAPEAGIFLSTDDGAPDPVTGRGRREGARERFRKAFGDRVRWTEPRSLDRGDTPGVQDALVDLWLLRGCDYGVGTWGSSFSEVAFFGRDAPLVLCRSGGVWGLIDRVGIATGLWARWNAWTRQRTGGRAGAMDLIRHVQWWPRRAAAHLLRTHAPGLYERLKRLARGRGR
jgi:hypothetical protein